MELTQRDAPVLPRKLLVAPVLVRALEPFPVAVRTLDALHLSSINFLQTHGQDVRLATYDPRQRAATLAMGFDVIDLDREF